MKSTNIYLIMHNNEVTLHTESYGAAMDYLMRAKAHGYTWTEETLGAATVYKMENT